MNGFNQPFLSFASDALAPGTPLVVAGDASEVAGKLEVLDENYRATGQMLPLDLQGGSAALPESPGFYRLDLSGTWPQGTAEFFVMVHVGQAVVSPNPDGTLSSYTNPMGIQITLDYPSDWYAGSVSQDSDLDPSRTGPLQLGVVVSNTEQAMPSQDAAAPSPGPLPQNLDLQPDFVTVTILAKEGTISSAPSDSTLPLSMDDAKPAPGPENLLILEAVVAGTPIEIAVSYGQEASSADVAAANAIVASIRPSATGSRATETSQATPPVSGAPSTPSSPLVAPAALTIECQAGGAQIVDGVVQAQADGVHIDVSNPSDAKFLDFHAVGSDNGAAFGGSADGRSVSPLSPGDWVVGCIHTASQSYGDVPTARFQVVDPESFWVEPGLDCTSPTSQQVGAHVATAGAQDEERLRAIAEAQLTGVQDADIFQSAGYAGTSWKEWLYWGILVRDGQRIAAVKLNYDGTGMTVESCVPDVHWIGA